MAVNQKTAADNSSTMEFGKILGMLCVFTIESVVQIFRKEWFLLWLALNLKTDHQSVADGVYFLISYKLHDTVLYCY